MRNIAKEEYIFKEALSQVMLQKKQVLIRVNSCNQEIQFLPKNI